MFLVPICIRSVWASQVDQYNQRSADPYIIIHVAKILSRMDETGEIESLKIREFRHFHAVQRKIRMRKRWFPICRIHQMRAAWEESKTVSGKTKVFANTYQTHCIEGHWKNMCKFVSSSASHKAHLLGPCQHRFLRLSHERFLLWNTSHAKWMYLSGHPAFQKTVGKSNWALGILWLIISEYMSLTETGLRALQTVHMRWSTVPCRWKPPRFRVTVMDFQMPSKISGKLRADPSFHIGDVSCHFSMSLFHVNIPCRCRCEERSFGIFMSPWPHRIGSMPMRARQPVYNLHRNRDMKYGSIFRMLSIWRIRSEAR